MPPGCSIQAVCDSSCTFADHSKFPNRQAVLGVPGEAVGFDAKDVLLTNLSPSLAARPEASLLECSKLSEEELTSLHPPSGSDISTIKVRGK